MFGSGKLSRRGSENSNLLAFGCITVMECARLQIWKIENSIIWKFQRKYKPRFYVQRERVRYKMKPEGIRTAFSGCVWRMNIVLIFIFENNYYACIIAFMNWTIFDIRMHSSIVPVVTGSWSTDAEPETNLSMRLRCWYRKWHVLNTLLPSSVIFCLLFIWRGEAVSFDSLHYRTQ